MAEFTAIPNGVVPTAMVVRTVLVLVSITETLLEPLFTTYTRFVSGSTSILNGFVPTAMVVRTVFVLVLITETEFAPLFAT